MSIDWTPIFAPAVAGLVTAGGLVLGAVMTGLTARLKAWLDKHGLAAEASAVASANAVIQPALQTEASVIAGKITSGQLDYTNRAQIVAAAQNGVEIVHERLPQMVAVAAPVAGALVGSIMGKVDQLMLTATASTPVVNPAEIVQNKGK